RLTDNGVQQTLTLEKDTDSEPLALAVVVETGGAGVNHLSDYQGLACIIRERGAWRNFSDGRMERLTTAEFGWTGRLILKFLAVRASKSWSGRRHREKVVDVSLYLEKWGLTQFARRRS